ncbi:MAG: hypothetical protein VKJ46_11970 [Leptolyngbyaceae bacterium]|nr:hypothetical protein [Leptolyngbyaceae bacterium]
MPISLEQSLTIPQSQARKEAFQQARNYIERAEKAGGVSAPVSKTFPNLLKDGSNVRVDIEVITGQAFVPDSTE